MRLKRGHEYLVSRNSEGGAVTYIREIQPRENEGDNEKFRLGATLRSEPLAEHCVRQMHMHLKDGLLC
jgi:hypothetical protein